MNQPERNNEGSKKTNSSRRRFLKFGLAGAGAAAVLAGGLTAIKRMEGIPQKEFPFPTNKKFKPFKQKNTVLTQAAGGFNQDLAEKWATFKNTPPRNIPGYTQLDQALMAAGWTVSRSAAPYHEACHPDSGVFSWEQKDLSKERYKFDSKRDAAAAIKKAARIFGADIVGITSRDARWDYSEFFDIAKRKTRTWDDFPFEPKSVIVIGIEMDFESCQCAPAWTASGTVGYGYTMMVVAAASIAKFLQRLGYQAVGSGNDLGNSVAYGIAAGLGEGARNGALIVPKYGPRIRLCRVYTELDFVEYDPPRLYGVESFCSNCKRCAESCPSKAITFDDKPTYEPTWGRPEEWFKNQIGIRKFHLNAEDCFRFWLQNGNDCGNCIASCPYNKPDFWHHRLVDAQNVISPGPVHKIMKVFDEIFGYGKVDDPAAVNRFWRSGRKL